MDISELNTDNIIEDYKKEIESINAQHAAESKQIQTENACYEIDEHFSYLDDYESKSNMTIIEQKQLHMENRESFNNGILKSSTPEVNFVKFPSSHLSSYLEHESDISQVKDTFIYVCVFIIN